MKPILFNTEMVKAILDGRKSVPRRVVKPQPVIYGFLETHWNWIGVKLPYRPGEILYVRETWCQTPNEMYWYKADNICLGRTENGFCIPEKEPYHKEPPYHKTCDLCEYLDGHENIKWRPSIHMPKEAARIFLRVTDVRVKRLQDITEEQARKEGAFIANKTSKDICSECDYPDSTARDTFKYLWNSTVKISDIPFYSWIANPWVWVIEFKRIDKEEAFKNE